MKNWREFERDYFEDHLRLHYGIIIMVINVRASNFHWQQHANFTILFGDFDLSVDAILEVIHLLTILSIQYYFLASIFVNYCFTEYC